MSPESAISRLTIPPHLAKYVVAQQPQAYTAIDHACWRYILRVSKAFFAEHAHPVYLQGLEKTGIPTERIPLIDEMNRCMQDFGWQAVAVSGFIPPAVFMEFQSRGILPIACDMRKHENIGYTPAPDIVHEAAGHAPMLANPDYAQYLRHYGEVARKAIYSAADHAYYLAVRNLSEVKERPSATDAEIAQAQQQLDTASRALTYDSEASLLSRLYWWTVEYGLFGTLDSPKIYGAGLLSSVEESVSCLSPAVAKVPFSLDCIHTPYDITRPQPQLFVTPDFVSLSDSLQALAQGMAFRVGGQAGLQKALACQAVSTVVLETGLQISGVLTQAQGDADPSYLRFQGPVQLALADTQLKGQGPDYHCHGYSTPLGPLAGLGRGAATLSDSEWAQQGFSAAQSGTLVFESGIEVSGQLQSTLRREDHTLLVTLANCTVRQGDGILFQPDWGLFDMACGSRVVSVFGGAADRPAYDTAIETSDPPLGSQKSNFKDADRALIDGFALVREIRESGSVDGEALIALSRVHQTLITRYPDEWLLRLELLELLQHHGVASPMLASLTQSLEGLAESRPSAAPLICRGRALF